MPVSTTALLSAPPISAFTSIDGPLLSPTDVAFEDPGRFRTKTGDTLLAGAVLGGLCSRPGRSSFIWVIRTAPSYLGSFENSALSHGMRSSQRLALPFRSFLVAEVSLPGNHLS